VTIAKGLGAGYQPVGAVLISREISETIQRGSGFFQHGHTYIGHAAACAGALAVQKRLHDDGVLDRVAPMGNSLERRLRKTFAEHPHVGDIRGRGLFIGLELVADRDSKEPFDPKAKLWQRVRRAGFDEGIVCYPTGGCIDGVRGDHVVLAPPFILADAQVDEIVDKLSRSIERAVSGAKAAK
jgi:adenosylmethionine-8-amino-7-oxononanoate aminotransferase